MRLWCPHFIVDKIPQMPRVLVLWEREEELQHCKEITPDRLPYGTARVVFEELIKLGYRPRLVACKYFRHTQYLAILDESMGYVKTVFLCSFPS